MAGVEGKPRGWCDRCAARGASRLWYQSGIIEPDGRSSRGASRAPLHRAVGVKRGGCWWGHIRGSSSTNHVDRCAGDAHRAGAGSRQPIARIRAISHRRDSRIRETPLLAADGRRKNGRWNHPGGRGKKPAGTPAGLSRNTWRRKDGRWVRVAIGESPNSETWRDALKRAGTVLDFVPDLGLQVVTEQRQET